MDVTAADISEDAIFQLAKEFPNRLDKLICGGLTALPDGMTWPLILGIQVFQHGDRSTCHAHIRAAQARLSPGSLIAVRVNAVGTDVWPAHDVIEPPADYGGLTIRYLAGAKARLLIHFFDVAELDALFCEGFEPALPARRVSQPRTAPAPGQWTQIEAIWRHVP